MAHKAGHDVNYIALSGILDAIGQAGLAPQIPLNVVGDYAGGSHYLVMGVLAALLHVERTGEGQVIDAAIVDGVSNLMATMTSLEQVGKWGPERGTNILDSGAPYYAVYETADHRWMALGAMEPKFWTEFQSLIGMELPDRDDPRNWVAIHDALSQMFGSRRQSEWCRLFEAADCCITPVLSAREAREHPHLRARNVYSEIGGITQPAPAPRFSKTPTEAGSIPVPLGNDTVAVLQTAGIHGTESLLKDGVIYQHPA
jgi:alpha-methylacyl-CoA racemase